MTPKSSGEKWSKKESEKSKNKSGNRKKNKVDLAKLVIRDHEIMQETGRGRVYETSPSVAARDS